MSVSGGGLSAGVGGNVELSDIVKGGDAFLARLKQFDERAALARNSIAQAVARHAAATKAQAIAAETQAAADTQLAANRAKAEELDQAIADAKAARAALDGRLEPLLKFLREPA